jgi:BirA family biotin operon repressor/biotin-[acetyl-CoA-carboxylase] ligase
MRFRLGQRAATAGYRLATYDVIGSTSAEAKARVAAGERGPLWIVARRQEAAYGRRGRAWASPEGNLAASLVLTVQAPPALASTLGFAAALAAEEAVRSVAPRLVARVGLDDAVSPAGGSGLRLKWPNDVLVDGAKLAGILLEAHKRPDGSMAIVIGVGVNVVAAPEGLPYPATSLRALGLDTSAETVFGALSDAWVDTIETWDRGRGVTEVLKLWRRSAAGIGAEVAVNRDGDIVRGIFETIDEAGRLIVRANDNSRIAITAGDVHFGTTASVRN